MGPVLEKVCVAGSKTSQEADPVSAWMLSSLVLPPMMSMRPSRSVTICAAQGNFKRNLHAGNPERGACTGTGGLRPLLREGCYSHHRLQHGASHFASLLLHAE